MTSIYRPKHSVVGPDADTYRSGHVNTHADPTPDAVSDNETTWAGRRKARPVEVLLPATQRWLDALPREIRPGALVQQFPRLANLFAGNWGNPNDCVDFISSLLVDRRGGRRGFPGDVLEDIQNLRLYYARLHPIVDWDR
jgi:hypothetical protein